MRSDEPNPMKIRHWQAFLFLLAFLSTGCARKNFYAETPVVNPEVYEQLQTAPGPVDSVIVKAGKQYKRGLLHRIFWGTHHRPLWNAPVKVPVLNMDTLKIEELGGGQQTTSMDLMSTDSSTYALRSLDKDPKEVLPEGWRKTFVLNVLRDQISAINPYAALVLPPMAAAAEIPHSTPKLVYVKPNDADFGEHADLMSDKVYLIEEKYNDKRMVHLMPGNAVDIVGTGNVLSNRFEEDDHFIDQLAFAKARLFDVLVHDWDRHEGQWEWAEYEENGNHYYRPIPKDRDNAFYRFQDGIIPWLFSRNWGIRKFESFDDEFNDVKALTVNSEFIDNRALSEVTKAQYDSLALVLQNSITDEVIEQAVRQYPDSVYGLIGETTKRKLINRRNSLREAAAEFYRIMAAEVLVVGTDQEDLFEVKRLNDKETEVTVRRESDSKIVYHRIINNADTKQIMLHGLAEDDVFEVSGEVSEGIKVVIVGGRGEDEIKDTSRVRGWGKKTWVYDTKRGTELEAGPETKDKRTKDVRVHAFDREGF
ncbi:hypothetical protein [Pontibacter akesuensis]|uniref:Uncharacterized protein n=1 Tax=Pontibacter akesuensis TaxID=388950 RepID=A0A1I7J641_9BACT|nr:hypothetical protein [Pontibacter akesuensis]GHA72172.1 hypothetical protein GCM10007389_27340 [Pontibacter akesuensis]SFU80665.1 hypothetical protein SAMN04487941_2529 [Pontibacter akesuensis]